MAGIYIHIPFCRTKCIYCDYFSIADCSRQQELLDALLRELKSERRFLGDANIETIYFGGGTPSIYRPKQLQQIIDMVDSLWGIAGVSEITVEVNPDDVTEDYLAELKETDFNRLSVGVQSFIDRDLQFMKRRHTAKEAVGAIELIKEAGFENVTLDLIYGLPQMSLDEWRGNIEQAIALGVKHISSYHLSVEERTPLLKMAERGEFVEISDEMSDAQFSLLNNMMSGAGFEHYEISSFARPGWRAKHNSSYWKGAPYLGVGPTANSYDGDSVRREVVRSVGRYIEGAGGKGIYETEYLTPRDLYNEFIMVSLRTVEGVNLSILERRFGVHALERFQKDARRFIENGMVVDSGSHYQIPPPKFLISNSVITSLFI